MEGKFKKIFTIFAISIVFTSHFPFFTAQKRERVIINKQSDVEQKNSEIPHAEYSIERNRNWFISGMNATASAFSSFFDDIFHPKNN